MEKKRDPHKTIWRPLQKSVYPAQEMEVLRGYENHSNTLEKKNPLRDPKRQNGQGREEAKEIVCLSTTWRISLSNTNQEMAETTKEEAEQRRSLAEP